jgi:hypothetical protein
MVEMPGRKEELEPSCSIDGPTMAAGNNKSLLSVRTRRAMAEKTWGTEASRQR